MHDVYPHILKALDTHAQDDLHRDKGARRHVLRALKSLEIHQGMVMNLRVTPHAPSDVILLALPCKVRLNTLICSRLVSAERIRKDKENP